MLVQVVCDPRGRVAELVADDPPPVARRRSTNPWTIDKIRSLGISTDIETAASIFGLSRTVAYDLLRRGQFPTHTFMVGRRIVVPVRPILEKFLVGADVDDHTVDDDDQREPPNLRVVAP